jgi:uncharacterized membrane protein YGL010W
MWTLKPRLVLVIEKYEKEHQNPICIRLHDFGIPLIAIGTMGLFGDYKFLLLVLNLVYFCSLDFVTGLLFTILFGGLSYLASEHLNTMQIWIVFATGWALAISGHVFFEKNRPAFFDNLMQTILGVGPMALFAKILKLKKP